MRPTYNDEDPSLFRIVSIFNTDNDLWQHNDKITYKISGGCYKYYIL